MRKAKDAIFYVFVTIGLSIGFWVAYTALLPIGDLPLRIKVITAIGVVGGGLILISVGGFSGFFVQLARNRFKLNRSSRFTFLTSTSFLLFGSAMFLYYWRFLSLSS